MLEGLRACEKRLRDLLVKQFETSRRRCEDLASRPPLRLPLGRIRDLERRLDECGVRLDRGMQYRHDRAKTRLDTLAGGLEALSPLNTLARGYSLTRKECDQTVVRRADEVRSGDRLRTLVQHGEITSRVE